MIFLKMIKIKSTFKFCQYLNEENIDLIHLNICVFRLHEKILVLGKLRIKMIKNNDIGQ